MQFLSEHERKHLIDLLVDHGKKNKAIPDPRILEHDCHLVFEALHVLADGLPDRLYAILHPASSRGLQRTREWKSDPGKTLLWFQRVAERGSEFCD